MDFVHYDVVRKMSRIFGVSIGSAVVAISASARIAVDDQIPNSAADAKPIKVGAMVPKAELRSLEGKAVKLSEVLGGKPTVLVFYRGGWCPFCNMHLADLGKVEGEIRAKGYQIVAITPDLPEELNKTLDKHHMTYKLYSDSAADAMKKFGVAFRLDDKTFTMYKNSYHIDLEKSSGHDHHILPVPSVFLINKSGKIVFASSNPDYKIRLKGSDILEAIDKNK